jgi:hypothetical protein
MVVLVPYLISQPFFGSRRKAVRLVVLLAQHGGPLLKRFAAQVDAGLVLYSEPLG